MMKCPRTCIPARTAACMDRSIRSGFTFFFTRASVRGEPLSGAYTIASQPLRCRQARRAEQRGEGEDPTAIDDGGEVVEFDVLDRVPLDVPLDLVDHVARIPREPARSPHRRAGAEGA